MRRPVVTDIVARDRDNDKITLDQKYQYYIFIKHADGKITSLFDEIMVFNKYLQEQVPSVTVSREYHYEQALLYLPSDLYQIKSITNTGLLMVKDTTESKLFSIVDRVWLVMEKIFEQQTFVVSEAGIIVQTDKNF